MVAASASEISGSFPITRLYIPATVVRTCNIQVGFEFLKAVIKKCPYLLVYSAQAFNGLHGVMSPKTKSFQYSCSLINISKCEFPITCDPVTFLNSDLHNFKSSSDHLRPRATVGQIH
jgi:hypothetical protein